MKNNLFISVLLATYNVEKTIELFFDSYKKLNYSNKELIIIDNNSTDGTHEFFEKNKNLISTLLIEDDKGIYDAWNKGIKLCNGDFICFMGADDVFLPDSLNKLTSKYSKNVIFISTKTKFINTNIVVGKKLDKSILNYFQMFCHIGSLTSIKLFKDQLFNEKYKISGDYEFYLRNKEKIVPAFYDGVCYHSGLGISTGVQSFFENYRIWKSLNIHNFLTRRLLLIKHLFSFYIKSVF